MEGAAGMRVVVESPLGAPTPEGIRENLRFALWCCRAVELLGHDPICSHVVKPWWLDDKIPADRERGIGSSWFWQPENPHWLFTDNGTTDGMDRADKRCLARDIAVDHFELREFSPECWSAYRRGEWPPHTAGFEVAGGGAC